jgi:glutamyl-tRNA synthetase
LLHLGHAATFWIAFERARTHHGHLVLRNDDLDRSRCRPEFVEAMLEDLGWFGLQWTEGPDYGGPCPPYHQSERRESHLEGWSRLREGGFIYPCRCSRREVSQAASAPHWGDEEPIYPGFCRPPESHASSREDRAGVSWRFRVPDGEEIAFNDQGQGRQAFVAGRDFGDFIVWRKDDMPAYQLATVLDDAGMGITEVVRGADLLVSTARQIVLYRALGLSLPAFYHCPLLLDQHGNRLAKRHESMSLRALRQQGLSPQDLRARIDQTRKSFPLAR